MRKPARTWPLQIVVASVASLGLVFFSLGGCSEDPPPASTPPREEPADPQGTIQQQPGKPPPTNQACEELGNWSGSALAARLTARTQSQSLNVPLANRPVPSKLGIIAVGTRTDLQGKAVVLGTGVNSNYETCTHCFAIALGCGADCKQAAWFYPKSGSALFTNVATTSGEKFEGTFTDVTLEQVSIDWVSGQSTPVPGGACIHVGQLTFSATVSSLQPSEDGGTTTSDASTDGGNGSTSGGGGTSSGGCFAAEGQETVIDCGGKSF